VTKIILLIINSGTTSWTLIGVLQLLRHALNFPYPVVGISSAWHLYWGRCNTLTNQNLNFCLLFFFIVALKKIGADSIRVLSAATNSQSLVFLSDLWHYDAYNIKSVIFFVALCGCENWPFALREKMHWGVFENWYWGKCLVMRGRKEEEVENCAVKGFLTYTARHMLLWLSPVSGWDGRNMSARTGENSLSFGSKTRRKQTNWKT